MEMKLQIIETPDHILALSDEKTLSVSGDYYLDDLNNNLHKWNMVGMDEGKSVWINKVVAYQPKGNAPELNLLLLPKIVIEDDVEKLVEIEQLLTNITEWSSFKEHPIGKQAQKSLMLLKSYKSATKVYSEEDLRKAIELTILNCIVDTIGYDNHVVSFEGNIDEIIQSLKQPKTPKWFVAKLCKKYKQVDYLHQIEEYDLVYKFTVKDKGKACLVGTYLYE
jgi:hypothetical protein